MQWNRLILQQRQQVTHPGHHAKVKLMHINP